MECLGKSLLHCTLSTLGKPDTSCKAYRYFDKNEWFTAYELGPRGFPYLDSMHFRICQLPRWAPRCFSTGGPTNRYCLHTFVTTSCSNWNSGGFCRPKSGLTTLRQLAVPVAITRQLAEYANLRDRRVPFHSHCIPCLTAPVYAPTFISFRCIAHQSGDRSLSFLSRPLCLAILHLSQWRQ